MTQLDFSVLVEGKPVAIDVDGVAVCVARVGECWLHGAEFDLRTGQALTPPATESLKSFKVNRNGNQLTITN